MKVLIIWPDIPGIGKNYLMLQSLEIPYISSVLKNVGIEVQLLDMRIEHLSIDKVEEILNLEEVDVVYIQGTICNHSNALKISKYIKKLYSHLKIVLGGEIATTFAQETICRHESIDYILLYDPELTLLKICNAVQKKDANPIDNVIFRNESGKLITGTIYRPDYDLNKLPLPDRSVYDLKKYLKLNDELTLQSSRGCPGNCAFCIRNKLYKFRTWDFSRIVDEIEFLMKNGFKRFFFSDDTFAFSDNRVEKFYEEVKKREIEFKFASNARLMDINEFKLKKLTEIGLYRFFVGIETLNPTSLTMINKEVCPEILKEKIDLVKSYGVEIHLSLMVGLPNDKESDLMFTIEKIKEYSPSIVTINGILVEPGTPLYAEQEKYGMVVSDPYWFEKESWISNSIMGTRHIAPEKVHDLIKTMYKKFFEKND